MKSPLFRENRNLAARAMSARKHNVITEQIYTRA